MLVHCASPTILRPLRYGITPSITQVHKGSDVFPPWVSRTNLGGAIGTWTHERLCTKQADFFHIVDVEYQCVLDRMVDKMTDHGQGHRDSSAIISLAVTRRHRVYTRVQTTEEVKKKGL
jgi:hypothetical protein